jgi:aminodeoxychorismate lyase
LDRSFLYGDGLFETLRIHRGHPFSWKRHWDRLTLGSRSLGIPIPSSETALRETAQELIHRNECEEGVLRIHLSRGVGRRGYSPAGAQSPTLVMTTHPALETDPTRPRRWRLVTSAWPLPAFSPLTPIKTANKLIAVMARAEAEAVGMDEALMLNPAGHVVEGTASNVFWIAGARLCTPPLTAGALAGITRGLVLELARELGVAVEEPQVEPAVLHRSDGLFMTLSSLGLVPVTELDGVPLADSPLMVRLNEAYRARLSAGE